LAPFWSDQMHMHSTDADMVARSRENATSLGGRLRSSALVDALHQLKPVQAQQLQERTIFFDSIFRGANKSSYVIRVDAKDHKENLRKIVAKAKSEKMAVFLMVLPHADCFSPECKGSEMDESMLAPYQSHFREVAQEFVVPLIEGDPLFDKSGLRESHRHFLDVIHPSPYGHKVLAQELAKIIGENISK